MTLIDLDKFVASFITAMKECSRMRTFSIPVCIKKALEDQGLEYKDGEIVKTQRRISAEAKETGYGESEDERIRKEIIAILQYKYENFSKDPKYCNAPQWIAWLEKQEGCEYIKKDWLEHIKQSWYKEGFIDGKYNGGTSKEWTINDAATLKELIDFLENGTAKLQHDLTRYANWLKIQFTPIEKQGEQKFAWSEEDEERFQSCLNILQVQAKGFMGITETINTKWLKSFKNRIKGE